MESSGDPLVYYYWFFFKALMGVLLLALLGGIGYQIWLRVKKKA
ncbi:MAG: hypothetical protein OEV94_06285 [Deltaproteobacteria bacterium]|nr:hypothetical protein [Deltaproteobacteria bacterium]